MFDEAQGDKYKCKKLNFYYFYDFYNLKSALGGLDCGLIIVAQIIQVQQDTLGNSKKVMDLITLKIKAQGQHLQKGQNSFPREK